MKFNIKNWQAKYLIKESKLRELDFKTPAEFKAYKARLKTKMRDTTKVNIAGKDTTAGEASGKDTPSASDADPKYREIGSEEFGEISYP